MKIRVVVARGVVLPSIRGVDDIRAPAPRKIKCRFCEDQMEIDEESYESPAEIALTQPYLRVPSLRAGVEMIDRGAFEAQLVDDEL